MQFTTTRCLIATSNFLAEVRPVAFITLPLIACGSGLRVLLESSSSPVPRRNRHHLRGVRERARRTRVRSQVLEEFAPAVWPEVTATPSRRYRSPQRQGTIPVHVASCACVGRRPGAVPSTDYPPGTGLDRRTLRRGNANANPAPCIHSREHEELHARASARWGEVPALDLEAKCRARRPGVLKLFCVAVDHPRTPSTARPTHSQIMKWDAELATATPARSFEPSS